MSYKNKLIKETESLRIFEPDEKDEKFEGFEVEIGEGLKMKLVGFNTATNNKTKEVDFAWKFKHEEKNILVYINSKIDEETKQKFLVSLVVSLEVINLLAGYNIIYMNEDVFPSVLHEAKIMDKKKNEKRS